MLIVRIVRPKKKKGALRTGLWRNDGEWRNCGKNERPPLIIRGGRSYPYDASDGCYMRTISSTELTVRGW
jgi:hypothetical protein